MRVCFNVSDVNNRHPFWLSELVDIIIKNKAFDIHMIQFLYYFLNSELIIKYNFVLKTNTLQQCISEPVFYDRLVYDFNRIF